MISKKLKTEAVLNELSGQSVFFQETQSNNKQQASPDRSKKSKSNSTSQLTVQSTNGDTQPCNHATTVSRYHATTIETVRRATKMFGKEAATHRFTVDEKSSLIELVYAYKRQGIRTSENQITRIAINFVVHDHLENGENSLLDLVLKALHE